MGRSIKDFDNSKSSGVKKDNRTQKQNIQNDVNSNYSKYSTMNENQLKNELFKEAFKMKKNGTLDEKMLENFYNEMSGSMTNEQRKKLRTLINSLK